MTFLVIIIILALIFDYINGFHDAANSIATIVSTKVLTPFQAVVWAAIFNFAAFFITKYWIGEFKIGMSFAKSINANFINLNVIFAALIAAIAWNLLTWWFGIPSSSSHALLGAFIGAAIAHVRGFADAHHVQVINYGVVIPIVLFIVAAPFIGGVVALVITVLIVNISQKANPYKAENWFRRLQLVSSALFSIGHGSNDAQKTLGLIAAALVAGGQLDNIKNIPNWAPLACFTAMALGTMSGG